MLQALLAALLFGASAPIAKVLLGDVQPIPLAGLLYLGSGISLLALKAWQRLVQKSQETEAGLTRPDIKWLVGAILTGGIAAPIVLLFSLRETPAATASLLLNFEGVATTLIAALIFKESIGRRAGWAILSITLASIVLSINPNQEWGFSIGALGVLTACLLWGLDNNMTCNISAKDPLIIVTVKGLVAGSFSLLLGAGLGNHFPSFDIALKAMLFGRLKLRRKHRAFCPCHARSRRRPHKRAVWNCAAGWHAFILYYSEGKLQQHVIDRRSANVDWDIFIDKRRTSTSSLTRRSFP